MRPRTRLVVWAVGMTAVLAACAEEGLPPGGPEDKTPPKVVATVPAQDSAGVAATSDIRVTFSEDMSKTRLERLLVFSPEVRIGSVGWDGRTLIVHPQGGLNPDTTYVVRLREGFRDHHNVMNESGYRWAFATSAHVDSGTVSGTIYFRRVPTADGVVDAYSLPRDSSFSPATAAVSDRTGQADDKGTYTVGYLPTNGRRFLLFAYVDKNHNRVFDADQEIGIASPDTVTLTPQAPVRGGVDFYIVDPNEPGVVRGRVINETTIDTLRVSVALFSPADSTSPRYYTLCDTTGDYKFGNVRGETYILQAFIDVDHDSTCSSYPCGPDSMATCPEPCYVRPDSLVVTPGETVDVTPITLRSGRTQEKRP